MRMMAARLPVGLAPSWGKKSTALAMRNVRCVEPDQSGVARRTIHRAKSPPCADCRSSAEDTPWHF